MPTHEFGFEYETRAEINGYQLFITEDAVAENIELGDSMAVTSDAYGGFRAISPDGEVSDYEIHGRGGDRIVDIVSMDGSGEELLEVELPEILGEVNHEKILLSLKSCGLNPLADYAVDFVQCGLAADDF